jgi:signal transduction histidine kinase
MSSQPLPTAFAPAERATLTELGAQRAIFEQLYLFSDLMAGVPDAFVVLNRYRQIVFANQAIFRQLGIEDRSMLIGQRPGEALNCVRAGESEGGCGTTEFCRECGAVRAILTSQRGLESVQECRIILQNGDALDLRVTATPVTLHDEQFSLFAVTDISHEKRRRVLERLFFHDILNTAGGMLGIAEILSDATPDELDELKSMVLDLSERLVDEIKSQQVLSAAEGGDLAVAPQPIDTQALLQETVQVYMHHEAAHGRHLCIDPAAARVQFTNDYNLARRVVGNMVKNALEASAPGDTVTLSALRCGDVVQLSVHNPKDMSRSVQLQIFQRSFSTKGVGRGLGTYSIKLFTERFMHGRVFFSSTPETGTTFVVAYPVTWPTAA